MKNPVFLILTPRALRDIDELVRFVGRFPHGKPEPVRDRIVDGCMRIRDFPELNPVEVIRGGSGMELRRHYVSQFAIVYAYYPPLDSRRWGIVTVRAVRHWRVEDVFRGVRDGDAAPGASAPLRIAESPITSTAPCTATRDS